MHWLQLILIFLLWSLTSTAQQYKLKIQVNGEIPLDLHEEISALQIESADSITILNRVQDIQQLMYSRSYLLSEAELFWQRDSVAVLQVETGTPVEWASLSLEYPDSFVISIPQGLAPQPEKLNTAELSAYIETYLVYLENNGYPFASIGFEEYDIRNDSISGSLFIQPGPYISFDSIVVKGYTNFSPNVLRYDMRFKEGMPYSEAYLQELTKYMDRIEYLRFRRAPAVAFSRGKTVLYIYVEAVKSNQIDGVVGLNTTEEGEVVFTGDFNLRLLNTLHRGEELRLRWQRPDESVSNLELAMVWPYLFSTPFWIGGDLEIFRQDTTFVNTNAGGLVKYLIESGTFISAGINYRSSAVLLEEQMENVNYGSFKTTSYKLGFERRGTNRAIVPTQGNELLAYVYRGSRTTTEGSLLQYGWSLYDAQYVNFFDVHVLKVAVRSESIIGDDLFENEMFRIGGLRSLRGFNEQSIFTSAYVSGIAEYRFMLGAYDFLTAFADMAYTEKKGPDGIDANKFLGVGAGMNFRTGGGIFSLYYALGRVNQEPFDFRTSKIHFGYINRF